MRGQGFETAPGKRGLLSPNAIMVDFKGRFPLVVRSRRILAASRRTVAENIDSLLRERKLEFSRAERDACSMRDHATTTIAR
jgi:hypothetical protein